MSLNDAIMKISSFLPLLLVFLVMGILSTSAEVRLSSYQPEDSSRDREFKNYQNDELAKDSLPVTTNVSAMSVVAKIAETLTEPVVDKSNHALIVVAAAAMITSCCFAAIFGNFQPLK